MWLILLFSCVSVILPNNAQKFSNDRATISYASNSEIWDSTRPPVTLTIQNGRTEKADQSITRNSDQPTVYSDQWKLQLLPIGFNSNRNSNGNVNGNERSLNSQFVPTFLQRPDTKTNNSVPYNYSEHDNQNEFPNVPVPYRPVLYFQGQPNFTSDGLISNADHIYSETLPNQSVPTNIAFSQPLDLYSNSQNFMSSVASFGSASQPNLYSYVENLEADTEAKHISSITEPEIDNFDSLPSRANEGTTKPLPTEDRLTDKELSEDINFYRSNPRILPPVIPAYFPPYSFVPFERDAAFQPVVSYPSNNQNFDRGSGLKINDQIREIPEKQVLPENALNQLAESVPSETKSTDFLPPQSVPLPFGGYPFGLYLPPFVPPPTPNIPTSGFPLNPLPLPQATHVSGESIVPGASQPLVPVRPLPNVAPEVLPQPDNLTPLEQTELITDPQVNLDETVPAEIPDTPKIPYEFGYDMTDGKGNDQHRKETSDISGVVTGSYGYKDARGQFRSVKYIADKYGFRAFVESNEPGVASSGSANVVIRAEQPPPLAIAEGRREIDLLNAAIPDSNGDLLSTINVPIS